MAKKYIIPTLISAKTKVGDNGITAHPTKLKTIVIIGANKKTILLEFFGTIFSFVSNLIASAKDWNKPKGPTTLGPRLSWIAPNIFLSAYTKNATEINSGIIIEII